MNTTTEKPLSESNVWLYKVKVNTKGRKKYSGKAVEVVGIKGMETLRETGFLRRAMKAAGHNPNLYENFDFEIKPVKAIGGL